MGRKRRIFSLTVLGAIICSLSFAGFRSDYFEVTGSDPADSGQVRLGNDQSLAWESSPTGTDYTVKLDSSEVLQLSGSFALPNVTFGSGNNNVNGPKTSQDTFTITGKTSDADGLKSLNVYFDTNGNAVIYPTHSASTDGSWLYLYGEDVTTAVDAGGVYLAGGKGTNGVEGAWAEWDGQYGDGSGGWGFSGGGNAATGSGMAGGGYQLFGGYGDGVGTGGDVQLYGGQGGGTAVGGSIILQTYYSGGNGENLSITSPGANAMAIGSTTGTTSIGFGTLDLTFSSDPADAGDLRLGNAGIIGWEASPAGTDVTLTVDASELMTASGAFKVTGDATTELTVGSTSDTDVTGVNVLSAASTYSEVKAYGTGQGAGLLYVGQDDQYGGGLSYNGDNTPAMVVGETQDSPTLFRRNANNTYRVASWGYDDSSFTLTGDLAFLAELGAPGAPTAAINATAGNLNGTYTYKISFVTNTGETTAGTASSSVSPVSQQVNLTAIPTGSTSSAHVTTSRRIWRTKNNTTDNRYYLVATIADNTTTTYTDNVADASLTTLAPLVNTTSGTIRGSNGSLVGQLDSGGDFWLFDDSINAVNNYLQWDTTNNRLSLTGMDIRFDNLQRNTVSNTYYSYPSTASGFAWAITSDTAGMRVFERGSDYLDYVFTMSDNTDSTDRYVWGETSWFGTMSDAEAIEVIPHGSATFAEKIKVHGGLYIMPATLWNRWQDTTNGASNAAATQYPIMVDTNVSTSALDFTERDSTGLTTNYDSSYWGGSLIKITNADIDLSRWSYTGDNPQWFIVRISNAGTNSFQWASTYSTSYTFNGADLPVSTSYTYLDAGSGRVVGVKFSKATVDVATGFSWAFQVQPSEPNLGINTNAPAAQIHSIKKTTTNSDSVEAMRLERQVTDDVTASNGIGQHINFYNERSSGATYNAARISVNTNDASGATAYVRIQPSSGGSLVNGQWIDGLGRTSINSGAEADDYLQLPVNSSTDASLRFLESSSLPSSDYNVGQMWYYGTQEAFQVYTHANAAGIVQSLSGTIFTKTSTTTVSDGTETDLLSTGVGTATLPVNFFVAGKTLRISGSGYFTADAANSNDLVLRLKLGSTEVIATPTVTLTPVTNDPFSFTATITCRTTGVSGTVFGQWSIDDPKSLLIEPYVTANTATTTIDTTASQAITVTADWVDTSGDSFVLTNASIEVLN